MVAFSPSELRGGPLADQLAGLEVVGGEGDVDGLGRVGRGVQRDHVEAGVAGLLDGRVDAGTVGRDQDAVLSLRDGVLDGLDLALLVAVLLACGDGQVDVLRLGGLLGAFLHGDEERVDGVLGDQGDGRGAAFATRGVRGVVVAAAGGERAGQETDGRDAEGASLKRAECGVEHLWSLQGFRCRPRNVRQRCQDPVVDVIAATGQGILGKLLFWLRILDIVVESGEHHSGAGRILTAQAAPCPLDLEGPRHGHRPPRRTPPDPEGRRGAGRREHEDGVARGER